MNSQQSCMEAVNTCILEQNRRIFVLDDKGTSCRARLDVGERQCQKIKVDGCLDSYIKACRCDWCVRDSRNGESVFIELKGSKLKHAVDQLENSINWFQAHVSPFCLHKDTYVVMSGGCPSAKSTMTQVRKKRIADSFHSRLVIVKSESTLLFDKKHAKT